MTPTKYYFHGDSRVAMRGGGEVYYLHGDHLGSTSLTTDQNGVKISSAGYLPYGGKHWTGGVSPTDFGFTAQRNEASFGLMDYNARYYSPGLGRFISPDPIVPEPESSSGFNRYRYARNNPLKYTDPSGHIECEGAVGCKEPPAPPSPGKDPEWDRAVSYDADLSYAAFADGRVHYNQYVTNPELYASDVTTQWASEAASYRLGAANIYGEYGLGPEGGCLGCVAESRLEGGLAQSLYSQGEPLDLLGGGSLGSAGGGGAAAAILTRKGPYTEPKLPAGTVLQQNGVTIRHFYRSGDHGPPHLHVSGNGPTTRIGQNGHPLKGDPELSSSQRDVIAANKSVVRRSVDRIGRWYRFQNIEIE